MTGVESQTEHSESGRQNRWRLAMTITTIVAAAGFLFATQQIVAKYLWDESAHTRTIGGVLTKALGILGLYLPLRLIRKRKQFAKLSPARQWLSIVGVPVLYLLIFTVCIEASLRSQLLILPRPFTPTAVVTYDATQSPNHRTSIKFRNALRQHHPIGGFVHSSTNDDNVERFNAHFDEGFLRHDTKQIGSLDGQTRLLDDGRVEITIDVDTKERLQLSVLGLEDVQISRDGKSINEYDAKVGKYKVVITGHPKK